MTTVQPRSATVTVYGGDYLDRIRHLERQAESASAAESNTTRTNDEVPESHRLAAEHDALVKEAEESALHVKVQALGRRVWKTLVAEHPPRDGHEGDKAVGVNEETFKDALVPASVVEPADLDLDSLADVDFERIYLTAFALNRGVAADPKLLASRLSQKNDETSN